MSMDDTYGRRRTPYPPNTMLPCLESTRPCNAANKDKQVPSALRLWVAGLAVLMVRLLYPVGALFGFIVFGVMAIGIYFLVLGI